VKVVSNDWSALESGYHLLITENFRLHQKWTRDIEAARLSRHQREHQPWSARLTQARARSAAIRWPCVMIVGVGVVVAVAMMILVSAPVSMVGFVVGFAATAGAVLALYFQSAQIGELSRTEPSLDTIPRLSVDITAEWWDTIAAGAWEQRVHGDTGVVALLRQLSAALPDDDYVCMREILVKRSLDADVIVFGPSGLWIFESKYLRGTITARNGQWSRSGGYEADRDGPIDYPCDQQWLDEQKSVRKTLKRCERSDFESVTNDIYGGIVFTHLQVDFDIDDSCSVRYGTTSDWVAWLTDAHARTTMRFGGPTPPNLGLAVFDALSTHGRTLGAPPARQSASALAYALADAMERKAAQFVAQCEGALEGAGRRETTWLSSHGIRPSQWILALLAIEVWLTSALVQSAHGAYAAQMAAFPSTNPLLRVCQGIGIGIGECLILSLIWVLPWALWLLVRKVRSSAGGRRITKALSERSRDQGQSNFTR